MTVQKALTLLNKMSPDCKKTVRTAVRGCVKKAINQEVTNKFVRAIEIAISAGMTDEEIISYIKQVLELHKRA